MKASWKAAVLILLGAALVAAAEPPAASDQVQVVVTAVGRHGKAPEPVPANSVVVFQEKQRRPVVNWEPLASQPVNLALVIDDSLGTGLGIQLDSLAQFIRALPANVRVAVVYTRNASAAAQQDFTPDHEAAARALRLPLGSPGAIGSPYLSLADLLERWPPGKAPGQVLFISHGIDLFRGIADSAPGINPDLQRAINLALRRGTVVSTLYAEGAGRLLKNFFLVSNGQGCLARLAAETGGEAYFQGFSTPVSFQPFLERFGENLGQQYLLTFRASLGEKPAYRRLRVEAEVPDVELIYPTRVYVPARQ